MLGGSHSQITGSTRAHQKHCWSGPVRRTPPFVIFRAGLCRRSRHRLNVGYAVDMHQLRLSTEDASASPDAPHVVFIPPSEQLVGDPERGYQVLVNEPYVSCGIPTRIYEQFFGSAPVHSRLPQRNEQMRIAAITKLLLLPTMGLKSWA